MDLGITIQISYSVNVGDRLIWSFKCQANLSASEIRHQCFSTICRPLIADSLAEEDGMFSFFDIETALRSISCVSQ